MFFQRKKNVGEVLQKQKFAISLPSDVWSEILRYFSRKQLCRQIYLVNRQLYNLANSRRNVLTTHVIDRMIFEKANRPRTFLNVFKSWQYNRVSFGDYGTEDLETHQLIKMPIPKPFIHFRKVYIFRVLEESTLKFLRDAKESFVGSVIHYFTTSILYNKDMRNQVHYLLQNVFHKPSYISVEGPCLEPRLKALVPDGLINCSRLKLKLYEPDICNNDTIRMILDWLSNDNCVAKNLQRDTGKKHLELLSFPRRFILELVQQIKDAFNDETLLFSDCVISFSSSDENRLCLEGNHTFILNRISTNERLSFFTYNHFPGSDDYFGLVYRLWCRRVVNEAEDLKMALHLQNSEKSFSLGIDLCDQQFYDFFSLSLAKSIFS